jgi:hypothetical protein
MPAPPDTPRSRMPPWPWAVALRRLAMLTAQRLATSPAGGQRSTVGPSGRPAQPLHPALLRKDAAVFAANATRDTELMAAATARGLRVLGGEPMVRHPSSHAIGFWRGDDFVLQANS